MSSVSLHEIAEMVAGTVVGDGNPMISGATNIEEAGASEITFAVPPHLEKAARSNAAAVIVPRGIKLEGNKPAIEVENPRAAFAVLLKHFSPPIAIKREVDKLASVAQSANLGKNIAIMPFAVVDEHAVIGDNTIVYPHVYVGRNVKIGDDCLLYSSVSIYKDCVLGNNTIVHSGAVIGGDGFGYVEVAKQHHKVPQVGNVVIGDDVEIGCNACIDRGTTGSTVIGKGTKIDNLVHVGHNDVIGENCVLVAFVGLPGSVKVGNNVTFAGQAASVGHVTIGDNCLFAGRAGITADVPSNSFYSGFPARPHKDWLKQEAMQRKIPDLMKRLQQLEQKIKDLQS